jgi:hypothetical protein
MRLLQPAVQLSLLAAIAPSVYAASSWGFSDATVSVQSKTAKGTAKERYLNTIYLISFFRYEYKRY